MDLTQRLKMFASQSYIVDTLAATGNTNNYQAYLTASYTPYYSTGVATFNGLAPTAVTGYATDTTFNSDYYATHSTETGVSFNWSLSASGTNSITFTVSGISGGTVGNSFSWIMQWQDTAGGLIYQETGNNSLSSNTCTFSTSNQHSPASPRYNVSFHIENMNLDSETYNVSAGANPPVITTYFGGGNLAGTSASGGPSTRYYANYTLYKNKLFFRFDTSYLTAASTIEAASLFLYTSSITNSNNPNVNIYVPSGWPPTTGSSAIYTGTTTSLVTAKALNTLTNGGYSEFTVDVNNISKTGTTDCRLQITDAPTQPVSGTTTNRFAINLNGATRPYLHIRYRL